MSLVARNHHQWHVSLPTAFYYLIRLGSGIEVYCASPRAQCPLLAVMPTNKRRRTVLAMNMTSYCWPRSSHTKVLAAGSVAREECNIYLDSVWSGSNSLLG